MRPNSIIRAHSWNAAISLIGLSIPKKSAEWDLKLRGVLEEMRILEPEYQLSCSRNSCEMSA